MTAEPLATRRTSRSSPSWGCCFCCLRWASSSTSTASRCVLAPAPAACPPARAYLPRKRHHQRMQGRVPVTCSTTRVPMDGCLSVCSKRSPRGCRVGGGGWLLGRLCLQPPWLLYTSLLGSSIASVDRGMLNWSAPGRAYCPHFRVAVLRAEYPGLYVVCSEVLRWASTWIVHLCMPRHVPLQRRSSADAEVV